MENGIKPTWIWYPGDFEIYHGMCQNYDREERGFFWPAYWKVAGWRHCVKFSAKYQLELDITKCTHVQSRILWYLNILLKSVNRLK
jgi:hypothetical protein